MRSERIDPALRWWAKRVQEKGKTRTAWLWSFIGRDEIERELIAYVFTNSRSGNTPVEVLGETRGKLVADAYSGYNKITAPGRRERAGCLAHLRRRFFEAQSTAPDPAKRAMDFILDVYRIERAALDADILGTPDHLEMRQTQSKGVMDEFRRGCSSSRPGTRLADRWARPSTTPSASGTR